MNKKKPKNKAQNFGAFARFRSVLEHQKATIENQLAKLKRDDPFNKSNRSFSLEPGTDAMEFEGHERITAVRDSLKKTLTQIKKALSKIGVGTYGKCEVCGQPIEPARLEIMPMATLCLKHEREFEKKSR
ncbi:MAG TPA: TraR/DksA C4-type zinc finger protein [Patescibacteria group bacterium]